MVWAVVGLLLTIPIALIGFCAYRTISAASFSQRIPWAFASMVGSGLYAALLFVLSILFSFGHAFFVEFPNVDLPTAQQKHDPALRNMANVVAAGGWVFSGVAVLAAVALVICIAASVWQKARRA